MSNKIDKLFAALMIIDILYKKGLVNEPTYQNICKKYNLHILQAG